MSLRDVKDSRMQGLEFMKETIFPPKFNGKKLGVDCESVTSCDLLSGEGVWLRSKKKIKKAS